MPKQRFFRYDGLPHHIPAWFHEAVSKMNVGDGTNPYDEVWHVDADEKGITATMTKFDKAARRHWGGSFAGCGVGDYVVEGDVHNGYPFEFVKCDDFLKHYGFSMT